MANQLDTIVNVPWCPLRELLKTRKKCYENFMKKPDNMLAGNVHREGYTKLKTEKKTGYEKYKT